MLIDKNLDEKINLISLQILRELAVTGFHLPLMDNIFLGTLMRILQSPDQALYGLTIDVLKALIDTTSYNTMNLINFGFLRVLCMNLSEFKLYKDIPI